MERESLKFEALLNKVSFMSMISDKVKIPKAFHEVLGEENTVGAVIFILAAGAIVTILICYLAYGTMVYWQLILLAILAIDIAGGVVSNMSQGTSAYYARRPALRWIFIIIHFLQPLFMWLLFPQELYNIVGISLATLTATAIINLIPSAEVQRMVAVFLMVLLFMYLLSLALPMVLHILLMLFIIKLVVAFAVRW